MSFLVSNGNGFFLDTSMCSHEALMDLLQLEAAPGFIPDNISTDIQEAHWRLLVSWMYEACSAFKVNPSVFQLAVLLLKKRMDVSYIDKKNYQIQAATSIFIASKLHDYQHIRVKHLTFYCGSYFATKELLEEELNFLQMLNHKLLTPLPCEFLSCFMVAILPTLKDSWLKIVEEFTILIARVLCQSTLLRHRPSLLSAAALIIVLENIATTSTDLEEIKYRLSILIRVSVLELDKETQVISDLPPLQKIDG